MEHAQPLDRTFSWRAASLAAALVVVIALAVVGAYVLVTRIGGTSSTPAAARQVHERTAPVHLRSRSHISILVLNANGVSHAAGNEASRLLAAGYAHAIASDAQSRFATSFVLFRPGWEAEAQRLAHDAHIKLVKPLDGYLMAANASDQLVVVIGAR